MFLHIHRCLVALCIPKLGVSASHMKEHGVFLRLTLHQNVFMYEMWSSSGLGPLICHPGTPIFLSLSPLAASFSNVLWIWIFILKKVRWLLLRLSPFCVHVFLVVTVSGPDQTWYQPASVVWAACRLYSSGSVYIHVCPGPLWRTVYLNDDATTTGRINVSAKSLN